MLPEAHDSPETTFRHKRFPAPRSRLSGVRRRTFRSWLTLTLSLVTVVSVHAERDWVAKLAADLADPLTGLRSNSGVDIVAHRGGVWVGTTNGVSFTDDLGQTWFTYDETTGLNASNTSALFALGNRIWTATASTEVINGASQAVGQGVQFSDDGGFLWQTPLDINGTLAASTLGPVKTTFDISGDSATVFASSFVGGLIGSDDGGVSWKNFHATAEDAAWFAGPQNSQPPLTSRYFSVVVDTAHTDSVVVLAGHAGGVTRFDFISKRLKPSSVRTTDFAYSPADNYIFMAGESGLSRADAFGYSNWLSVFDSTVVGLPGNIINQVHFFGGRLFVGVVDSLDGDAIGFVSSDATLGSFSPVGPATVLDSVVAKPGAAVYDFDDFGNRYLYVSGGGAGLFVSADTGLTWTNVATDTNLIAQADPGNGRNNVYSARADSLGNLWCGTDSGLVKLYINRIDQSGAVVDSAFYLTLIDAPQVSGVGGRGGSSRRIEIQQVLDFTGTGVVDSVIIWSANQPTSDSGVFATYRIRTNVTPPVVDTVLFAGVNTRVDQMASRSNQILFAGVNGLRRIFTTVVPPLPILAAVDTSRTPRASLPITTATALLSVGDTTHLGTTTFAGLTTAPNVSNQNWHFAVANNLPFTPDTIALYTFLNSGLPGNFTPALGLQERPGVPPIVWVAARTADTVFPARDRTDIAKLDFARGSLPTDSSWVGVPGLPPLVWNFGFNGDTIYAATEEGLYLSVHPDSAFSETEIFSIDPNLSIPPGSPVNGVRVINGRLWVAAEQGIATRPLGGGAFEVFRRIDTTNEVYAFPTPFSPNNSQLDFHYIVPSGATGVTIFIYDFAMNLVSQVNDNEPRNPGEIVSGFFSDKWDGENDNGERVAPGMYYFKLAFSNGEDQWGKLMVIP